MGNKLDRTLAKEIMAANGDGSRDAKFALLKKIDAATNDMSNAVIMTRFNEMVLNHGRAVTAICIAATLYERRERLDGWRIEWARQVLSLWTLKPASGITRAIIHDDELHPTRICEYAAQFINCTTEY